MHTHLWSSIYVLSGQAQRITWKSNVKISKWRPGGKTQRPPDEQCIRYLHACFIIYRNWWGKRVALFEGPYLFVPRHVHLYIELQSFIASDVIMYHHPWIITIDMEWKHNKKERNEKEGKGKKADQILNWRQPFACHFLPPIASAPVWGQLMSKWVAKRDDVMAKGGGHGANGSNPQTALMSHASWSL